MAPFDHKDYEQRIVKPLRGRSGRLPDDLLPRYAVDLTMSDADLVERLAQVRAHWNRCSTSTARHASYRSVYKAFLRADEELRRGHGDELSRMSWWRKYSADRAGSRKGEIGELARMLRTNFGDLGLITPAQLEATTRASFPALAPDEVGRALSQAGVRRCDPIELPKTSGMSETLYRRLASLLADAEVASIAELLHGDIGRLWILTSFRSEPPSAGGLTASAVRQATNRENRRSGNQAAREALGLLSTYTRNGLDLRLLTLFHLLDGIRRHHKAGAPAGALLRQLEQARLDPGEARQAVISVLSETTLRPEAGGLAMVTTLLEEGQLIAAQKALSAISGEDAAAARALVERQAALVREHRDAARQAVASGNETEARERLRRAVLLATDDDELVAELRRIPPAPVLEVIAAPDGVGIRVSWRIPASHDDSITYRLVRRTGRAPADSGDGAVVVEDRGTVAVDSRAPAGRLVGYAVFASAEGGTWSRPTAAMIEILPPVHNVHLTVENGVVEGRWQVHPEVVAVEVCGEAGVAVPTSGKTAFRDGTPESADPAYTLTALYRRADATLARSAPTVARTTTHGPPQPVSAMRIVAVDGQGAPRVAISWRQAADTEVVVRRAAEPPPWDFGAVVPAAEVGRYGQEVSGDQHDDGDWRTLTVDVPTGRFWYLPLTVGPGGDAVCGHADELGVAMPVTGLRHQRFGDELVLSWSWPAAVGIAEVRWTDDSGSRQHRLTRQQYQTAGGYRARCGTSDVHVEVRGVVLADGGECLSPPASLVVEGSPPRLSYTVDARRPLFGPATVRVRLTVDRPVLRCTVSLVVARGLVMPRRPDDGQVLLRSERELHPGQEVEFSTELPRLRRPYWLRCFVDEADAVRLIDPPTSQLKVP